MIKKIIKRIKYKNKTVCKRRIPLSKIHYLHDDTSVILRACRNSDGKYNSIIMSGNIKRYITNVTVEYKKSLVGLILPLYADILLKGDNDVAIKVRVSSNQIESLYIYTIGDMIKNDIKVNMGSRAEQILLNTARNLL